MIARATSVGTRPRALGGARRFALYLALQLGILAAPPPWLTLPAAVVLALGLIERKDWARWAVRSRYALVAALLPAIVGFPFGSVGGVGAAGLGALAAAWAPALARSGRLVLVLASAAWLSDGMSPVELRDALVTILRPLGAGFGGRVARSASLTMAFLPWTAAEARAADEAARLRGSDPRRRPARHIVALSVPLVSRSLEKARRGAEALSLRDPGFGG